MVEGDIFLASSLPSSVAPRSIRSNLEPPQQSESVWRWGHANNAAAHLMCLKCLWPARPALWSATSSMVSQVQGDAQQRDGAEQHWHGGTFVSRGAKTRKWKSPFSPMLCVFFILSNTLNCVLSINVIHKLLVTKYPLSHGNIRVTGLQPVGFSPQISVVLILCCLFAHWFALISVGCTKSCPLGR